jgi:hypothetical protein
MTNANGIAPADNITDARHAGIILLGATLLAVLMMAHHPSAGSHDSAALAIEIGEKAGTSRLVHGVLIALIGAQLFALCVFCDRIGSARPAVRAGLVAYSIGAGAMIGAALISGFIISNLAAHYAQPAPADSVPFIELARLCMIGNQALAKLGVVAMSAAILLWSIALFHASRRHAWIAAIGVLAGAAPAIGLIVGALQLDVRGMTLVVVCQTAWLAAVGVQLIRREI